jgi:ligand-binding sensor domain-containing protein
MNLGRKMLVLIVLLALSACAPVREQPVDEWTRYLVTQIWDMAFDADGDLWIVHGVLTASDSGCNCDEFQPGEYVSRFDVGRERATRYTSADGLLKGQIQSVTAGPDGVMWFASASGVSYFDGEGWGAYTATHGLPPGQVPSIGVAPSGEVWAATMWVGVSLFDGETWTVYPEVDELVDGVALVSVAPDGTAWAGGRSIARFDGADWIAYAPPSGYFADVDITSSITAIVVAPDGGMWFAAGCNGVFHLDGEDWFHYASTHGLADDCVTSIATAPDGGLWFGTKGGVSRFDGEMWTTYTTADGLAGDHTTTIAVAPDGALWFGSEAGLSRYRPPSLEGVQE